MNYHATDHRDQLVDVESFFYSRALQGYRQQLIEQVKSCKKAVLLERVRAIVVEEYSYDARLKQKSLCVWVTFKQMSF